ncbi:type VI secretion system tube protein TssD [Aquimarina pacifica]|uniref:type VI secretion system tube protein TssD n=1 Tax=Aquimarina pacifica TaxID=1296415 RepID=UPI000470A884|nr:type VI secretion system tube protein TssD [Aquimarina pacifica]
MSFEAKLHIEDQEITVLHCRFNFRKSIDAKGQPVESMRGGQISLKIEATNKIDFISWMKSSNQLKSGKIVFHKRDNMGSMTTVEFSDAHCIDYEKEFNAIDANPFVTRFVMSVKDISENGSAFENDWS